MRPGRIRPGSAESKTRRKPGFTRFNEARADSPGKSESRNELLRLEVGRFNEARADSPGKFLPALIGDASITPASMRPGRIRPGSIFGGGPSPEEQRRLQ